jgi:iron complex transport system substrate-binding protein
MTARSRRSGARCGTGRRSYPAASAAATSFAAAFCDNVAVYGKTAVDFPQRIVCLSADTVEIAYAIGAGDRVVGVPGTARRPDAAREKARVGGFTTFRLDRILALEPDIVLAFSDLQKDVVRDLVTAGVTVLCTNPRSLDEVLASILLVGGALGREAEARALVQDMRDEIKQVREYSSVWPDRPRVYFEEWPDPLIAGIGWVSDMIEIAGGQDIFSELRVVPDAEGRKVEPREVAARDPEIVLASWCGKPVDVEAIATRPGWESVSAVRRRQIFELDGADVLAPGPSLMVGLRRIHEIVQAFQDAG